MNNKTYGMRERKRHETYRQLEVAAIELVTKNGLDHTTVEDISLQANVSTRTFFNYFESKEDALLGFHAVESTDAIATRYIAADPHDSVAVTTIKLMAAMVSPAISDARLYAMRKKLIKQHPELLERQMNRMVAISQKFIEIVQSIATSKQQTLTNHEAELLFILCGSCIRIVIREWAQTKEALSMDAIEDQAIKKLNEVITAL